MILKLRYYGDPVLRKKCEKVSGVTAEIKKLVQDMIETMIHHNGIGLAASQIGELVRVFIIREELLTPNGDFTFGPPRVFINPVLSAPTPELETMLEGCLSIPGLHVEVERPKGITIEAMGLDGKPFKETIIGFTARQLMHENDHLNGTLHVDRCSKEDRNRIENSLRRIKEKYSSNH
ncbi:MAG TPA: peptide deformylase [Chlamydiales bacterium]|nr:peptide deformylase [Chlamydiales bacterium]